MMKRSHTEAKSIANEKQMAQAQVTQVTQLIEYKEKNRISSEDAARIHQVYHRILTQTQEALNSYKALLPLIEPESNGDFRQYVKDQALQAITEALYQLDIAKNMLLTYGNEVCTGQQQTFDLSQRNTPPLEPAAEEDNSLDFEANLFSFFSHVPQNAASIQAEAELIQSLGEYIAQL